MTRSELKEHARAIQRAVETLLPEDEPDCVRPWVYETAVKVIADRIGRQILGHAGQATQYKTARQILRGSERRYGLDSAEALEMAYENLRGDALATVRLLKQQLSVSAKNISKPPLPAPPERGETPTT
jgi:hypothetical protein